jgi:hypothetical protein
MSKNKNRRRPTPSAPTAFEQARDELFQHIMRCGVIGADPAHQLEWFDDTIGYLAERYPELTQGQVAELKTLGVRFSQPPKAKSESDTPATSDAASAA